MNDRQEGPVQAELQGVGTAGVVLCDRCYPEDGVDREVYTVGMMAFVCVACGKRDGMDGVRCTMYVSDPRPAVAALAELQTLADSVERLMALGPHAGVLLLLPHLAPHEQRVVQEAIENQGRLERLTAFIGSQVFAGLQEEDRRLLYRQHAAMTELAFVLAARIQRFKPAAAADSEGGEV